MKTVLKSAILASALTLTMPAQADMIQDLISKIMKTVKGKGAGTLCREANAKTLIFSLRSFEGKPCEVKPFGAFAVMMCSGKVGKEAGFIGSGCWKKAAKALGVDDSSDQKAVKNAARKFFMLQAKTGKTSPMLEGFCEGENSLKKGLGQEEAAALNEVCPDTTPEAESAQSEETGY